MQHRAKVHLCDSGWKYADSKVLPRSDEFYNVPFNKYTIAYFINAHVDQQFTKAEQLM